MNEKQRAAIEKHGRDLLAIFPNAQERDPVKLCKKLHRLELAGHVFALRLCNGPPYSTEDAQEKDADDILTKVNTLLGNKHEYQPKTGAKCGCKRGVQRDNCPNCEGTGAVIDFRAIREAKPLVPIFINRDPRGYALKIESEWLDKQRADHRTAFKAVIERDWGGYGIIAPEIK